MIDRTLLNTLDKLIEKEKIAKHFKSRLRVKGEVVEKSKTKKENIKLTVKRRSQNYTFLVLKSHKERYALAEKLKAGEKVYAEGLNKPRANICVKLRRIESVDESEQSKLV